MASNVVVLDSSARRAVVKTTPTTHLSDVLQEACLKLRLDPSRYGLKNSAGRTLDLSQPIRLTGLSSGAKLQLLVLSSSPSAVSVALQLPESETGGGPSRLTDKLASSTTLWILLRHFETVSKLNLTARGTPHMGNNQITGSGRLFHETPVIHMMGKEFSFVDLQKTLSQLGLNSGSVLLRLSFRDTETPLEEAMAQIEGYFRSTERPGTSEAHAGSVGNVDSTSEAAQPTPEDDINAGLPPESNSPRGEASGAPSPEKYDDGKVDMSPEPNLVSSTEPSIPTKETTAGHSQRPITVLAPPSTAVPAAARRPHIEKDYEPTIDHAKRHQSRLADFGRNKPLPSDAELAAQAEVQQKKLAEINEIKIKVRFPDQSQVIGTFSKLDAAASLYEFVRSLMRREEEPFSLSFLSNQGPKSVPKGDSNPKLISGLGMVGAVLVNVVWEEGASSEARVGKALKEQYQEKATQIEIKEPEGADVDEKSVIDADAKEAVSPKGKGKGTGGVPKWLKLPGKK